MKFKLDEDLGKRGAELLAKAGHDVATVAQQKMTSASDADLLRFCTAESRAIVTLDQGFSNPFQHPPGQTCGIAVIRADPKTTEQVIHACLSQLVAALEKAPITGKLWIVEPDKVREFRPGV